MDQILNKVQHLNNMNRVPLKHADKKRQDIYDKSGGLCWYCGDELQKGWHADHFKPILRKSEIVRDYSDSQYSHKSVTTGESERPHLDVEENKVPSCPPCNLFKATFTIEAFRCEIQEQANRARKTSVNFRTAERFGLIEVKSVPVVFWFEKNGF